MFTLVADRLSFGWSSDTYLFENLNIALGSDRTALIGHNGVGKSTLLRLIIGELAPTQGSIKQTGRLHYHAQSPDLKATLGESLGIADTLAALARVSDGGIDQRDYDLIGTDWDIEARAKAALSKLGLDGFEWTRTLGSLSGGQVTRARLAGAVLAAPDLLVLDEPTNDLDAEARDILYQFVAEWSGGLLLVSHDRALLEHMDQILELTSLGLRTYGGNYSAYRVAKQAEIASAERRLSDARKQVTQTAREIQKTKERSDRRAQTGKRFAKSGSVPKITADAMARRAQKTSGRLQVMADQKTVEVDAAASDAQKELEVRKPLDFNLQTTGLPRKKRVLDIEDITLCHPGQSRPVLDRVSCNITGPERIAITGPNGAGKSTLLAVMSGGLVPQSGAVRHGIETWELLDQRLHVQAPEQSILDAFLIRNSDSTEHQARAALARFGFRNTAALAQMGNLSGGERLRAMLATILSAKNPPELLMLDEPTNHLDLESIETLETALRAYDGALVVVSHDQWFLDAIEIDREIVLVSQS